MQKCEFSRFFQTRFVQDVDQSTEKVLCIRRSCCYKILLEKQESDIENSFSVVKGGGNKL